MEHRHDRQSHQHILPVKTTLIVGGCLLFLTALTVWVAGIDLGPLNFPAAMAISTLKGTLVALFFMGLLYDRRENALIFGTSFVFLAIFMTLTSTDVFFRGDVYVKGPVVIPHKKSHLMKPWVSSPKLIAAGRQIFKVQCVMCHGPQGFGNGPAAASLNPHPRNFHKATGWVNGRKETMVFKTLKEGVPGSAMPSFAATLSADERWELAAYVLSLGPQPVEKDTPADFAKIGINPNAVGGGEEKAAPTVPIEFAMKKLAQAELPIPVIKGPPPAPDSPGGRLYQHSCATCHGVHGEGGIRVKVMADYPNRAYVKTIPVRDMGFAILTESNFDKQVIDGIPGNYMPGYGQLSGLELHELYGYVKLLSK